MPVATAVSTSRIKQPSFCYLCSSAHSCVGRYSSGCVGGSCYLSSGDFSRMVEAVSRDGKGKSPTTGLPKNKIVCPHCGHTISSGNFCRYCSQKVVVVCNCWVLKKPFNCGMDKCPGMKLLTNAKLLAAKIH